MEDIRNLIEILCDSLEKKVEILEKIEQINCTQKDLLSKEDFDVEAYDHYVNEKDALADDIALLDRGFQRVYEQVGKELGSNKEKYASDIKKMQGYIRDITDLVSSIQADEKRMFETARDVLNKKKGDVGKARKNSNMAANYYRMMSKTSTDPQFMDKHN